MFAYFFYDETNVKKNGDIDHAGNPVVVARTRIDYLQAEQPIKNRSWGKPQFEKEIDDVSSHHLLIKYTHAHDQVMRYDILCFLTENQHLNGFFVKMIGIKTIERKLVLCFTRCMKKRSMK